MKAAFENESDVIAQNLLSDIESEYHFFIRNILVSWKLSSQNQDLWKAPQLTKILELSLKAQTFMQSKAARSFYQLDLFCV